MTPEEDGTTAIGTMHKNLVKIARVVPNISSRTDRHIDRQTHRHTKRERGKDVLSATASEVLAVQIVKYYTIECLTFPENQTDSQLNLPHATTNRRNEEKAETKHIKHRAFVLLCVLFIICFCAK